MRARAARPDHVRAAPGGRVRESAPAVGGRFRNQQPQHRTDVRGGTFSHLYVYRHRDDVRSVIHTHSTFATAWAATGQPIPCCLTAVADEFGGPVPCGGYANIGTEEIGEQIMAHIGDSPAILLKQHGVFTIGATIEKAVKAAVMVEDVARTITYAKIVGRIEDLPPEAIAANHDRYMNRYGTAAASTGVK